MRFPEMLPTYAGAHVLVLLQLLSPAASATTTAALADATEVSGGTHGGPREVAASGWSTPLAARRDAPPDATPDVPPDAPPDLPPVD